MTPKGELPLGRAREGEGNRFLGCHQEWRVCNCYLPVITALTTLLIIPLLRPICLLCAQPPQRPDEESQ